MAKEIPMLFSEPMVIATLSGTKTETRTLFGLKNINKSPNNYTFIGIETINNCSFAIFEPNYSNRHIYVKFRYGHIGDKIWVRETFVYVKTPFQLSENVMYKADSKIKKLPQGTIKEGQIVYNLESKNIKWLPSIFMPRIASRLNLEIIDISIERLNDITKQGAIDEGIEKIGDGYRDYSKYKDSIFRTYKDPIESYMSLWVSINGLESFELNPFIWVIKYRILM